MTKQIQLTQGKFALVDDCDFDAISKFRWHTMSTTYGIWYARRNGKAEGKQFAILMHREIMSPPEGMEVDHIDHNGLNNTRSNLRVCTHHQNMSNGKLHSHSSKFRGVTWNTREKKWIAQIKIMGVHKNIGYFDSEVGAAKAYNQYAKKNFGEFAVLNEI